MQKYIILIFVVLGLSLPAFSQKKAVILENLWINDLNNFTPKEFFNSFYGVVKNKLGVKDIADDPLSMKVLKRDDTWNEKIKEKIKAKNIKPDSAYFITLSSELRLPTINVGRLIFKNPPRSSKFIFIVHVFDGAANLILADTVVNRGCILKSVDEGKDGRSFYSDYESFVNDMKCHLEVITRSLQQIVLPRRREYRTI